MSKSSILKAIEFIEKNRKRIGVSDSFSPFDDDGLIYATDSHQVVRTIEEIDISKMEIKGVKHSPELYEDFFENESFNDYENVSLPLFEELKNEIKNLKGKAKKKKIGYVFPNGIVCNAEYLANAILATDVSEAYVHRSSKTYPLFFLGELTQYLLLPINSECGQGKKSGLFVVTQ